MGTGYTRNDTPNNIADGNVINASDLDGEFDAVEAAFNALTGHTHDGTAAEGAPIEVVGPAQDLVVTATEVKPKTDNTLDLGTSLLEFKDLYLDGTANIDSLVADTADINGGTIDGTTIGGTTPAAGTFTTVTGSGDMNIDSGTLFVDASADAVGIGTISPLAQIHSTEGSLGLGSISGNANQAFFENSGNSGITIGSGNINLGTIFFADPQAVNIGALQYDHSANAMLFTTNTAERLRIDSSGNVGIGTTSPAAKLDIVHTNNNPLRLENTTGQIVRTQFENNAGLGELSLNIGNFTFSNSTGGSVVERMRIDSSGNVLVGKTSAGGGTSGVQLSTTNNEFVTSGGTVAIFNRNANDGTIISLRQNNTEEGTISVSGSTVTLNGAHLSRWSRLTDDSKDASILRGTVMTNLDAMVVWAHDAVEAQDAVYETVVIPAEYDEDGNELTPETTEERLVSEAVEAKEAYTEDNEQLNKMVVSSIEGDPNVAGVFSNWDDEDDFNDLVVAMTGDFVIRIAQGTTVQRGDLLMSAGDGTAKPQGDDIVRSKTIAKVTSTHVSHTYDDGSYLVPCVLMAC